MTCYFVLPMEIVTRPTGLRVRQEKYIPALRVARQIVDFGDIAICRADTTLQQFTEVCSNADVLGILDLQGLLSDTELPLVEAKLESLHAPGHWLKAGMSYREIVDVLIGMALVHVRILDQRQVSWTLTGNLDVRFSDLPPEVQSAFIESADQFDLDQTAITSESTVRDALYVVGEQHMRRQLT